MLRLLIFLILSSFSLDGEEKYIQGEIKMVGISGGEETLIFDQAEEISLPQYLYLILSEEDWKQSQQLNKLVLSKEHEQFIHLAQKEQIQRVVDKFFKESNPIVLTIDVKKMSGRLVYEVNPGGANKYFHLYKGSIPFEAIVKACFQIRSPGPLQFENRL